MTEDTLQGHQANPTFIIRPATPEDGPAIAQIHVGTWRDTYAGILPDDYLTRGLDTRISAVRWTHSLRRHKRGCQIFVAEELHEDGASNVVGYISCGPARNRSHQQAEIFELYVDTEFQDRGLGRSLCRTAAQHGLDRGCRGLRVQVLEANPARFFYESLGAYLDAHELIRFAGRKVPALIYVWPDVSDLVGVDAAQDGGSGHAG